MFSTLILWKSFGLHSAASLKENNDPPVSEPRSAVRAFRLAQFRSTPFRPPASVLTEL